MAQHCVRSQQFARPELETLFDKTRQLKQAGPSQELAGKILISLFYESSTRTRFSFEAAMLRLGGHFIGTDNAREFSSAVKGESLEDSIRVVSRYGDIIVLRHTDDDASERAARVATVPIINAGCGKGQHPTQALVDLYTIREQRGGIDGLSIMLVGDLANGRTVRSLAYLLGKYRDISITFVSPPQLKVQRDIIEYLDHHHVMYRECGSFQEAIQQSNSTEAVYMTRVQKERNTALSESELCELENSYQITKSIIGRAGLPFIMHPLPRNSELPTDIDILPQAVYFDQAENGLWVRMALLSSMLKS